MKSNLEPIDEADLDMEGKMKRGGGAINIEQDEKPLFSVEHEKIKEVSVAEKDAAYGNILAKVKIAPTDDTDDVQVSDDAKAGAVKTDAETQIQHLVEIAMQKGVVHAVKVAKHMENNYVLDTFHDRLMADELHDALVKKGLLGQE